ncbi:MAG: autotransporter outer membrane beta-barrel domain-containing protein [Halomonas sp.]|nr:autotransporter outer membrane beta-barrel domain-containing protein [Halomonas sp.]MBR2515005.1 autotransporter outer membrane beta-barrel domain-containing protein [Halomonas sp.]
MQLQRAPLATAISLAVFASTTNAAPSYDYVPYYEYQYFTQEEIVKDDFLPLLGPNPGGKYLTVDASQNTLNDPLFLVVGTQIESAYERQNPTDIIAENRNALTVDNDTWAKAIVVNTSDISATGTVRYPEDDEDEKSEVVGAIDIHNLHLVGLKASDPNAARLDGLPVFASGEEQVFLYNSGTIMSDASTILLISDKTGENGNIISDPAVIEGSLVNLGLIESRGGYSSEEYENAESYALGIFNAELYGNIVNGLAAENGQAVIRGRDGAIYMLEGSVLQGDIVNRGLMEGYDTIRIEDSEFNGRIINHKSGEMRANNGTAISIENTSGDIFIDQRGTLHALRYLDDSVSTTTELGQAMYLQGQNVHARLSDGSVIGDIDLDGATVTLAGGEYQGTITNRGGVFVVDGIRTIDGSYEQDADATLRFSSQQLSSLSAERITLADGSTLVFGNSEAYRDGKQLVALEATELDFDLEALNLKTDSGLYRVSKVELSDDGSQLLVTYGGQDGEEIARRAIDASNATGAQARQLHGLGNALNRILANSADEAAVRSLIDAIGDGEQLEQLLPDSSGAVAGGTASASQSSNNAVSARARGVAAGDTLAAQGVWIKGLYGEVDQRALDGVEGFDSETSGFVLGGDVELNNGSVLGLAWSRSTTDVDGKNGLVRSDIDFDQLTAYAGRSYGNWLFDTQLSYGWGDNETSRRVLGNAARANFDSEQFSAVAAAAYEYRLDSATRLTPRISTTYSNLELDAYEERGAGSLNLRQDEQRYERFELGLEGELAHTMPLGSLMAEPRLTLGAYHDFQGKARSNVTAFTFAPEETFIVEGPKPDKTRYSAGLGVDLYSEGGFTTSVDYAYGWSDSMSSQAGSLQVRYDF